MGITTIKITIVTSNKFLQKKYNFRIKICKYKNEQPLS